MLSQLMVLLYKYLLCWERVSSTGDEMIGQVCRDLSFTMIQRWEHVYKTLTKSTPHHITFND